MTHLYVPQSIAEQMAAKGLKSVSLAAHRDASINPTLTALKADMTRTNWIGRKGDLSVFVTEKDLGDGAGKRPCMLIAHVNNPSKRHVFFAMRDLWVVLERYATEVAIQMAEILFGGHTTKDDAFRVLDCLFEFAEDVKNAKPPRWLSSKQWLEALAEDGFTIYKDGQALNA